MNSPVYRNYATGSILGKLSIEFWASDDDGSKPQIRKTGVARIRRRKLFDVQLCTEAAFNPSLDTIYRGDSVDKWPLVRHVHPQNRNARVPLIDRKPIFTRQLSPNTKFSARKIVPALERLNRRCNYSFPPVMPYLDFARRTKREEISFLRERDSYLRCFVEFEKIESK